MATKSILILGGTGYMGKPLIEALLEKGHEVAIVSRGMIPDGFGSAVRRITIDRTSVNSLRQALIGNHWSIVYDFLCYDQNDAETAMALLPDIADRYVMVSSAAVYPYGRNLPETAFVPSEYTGEANASNRDYAEGKREAEAWVARNAKLQTTFVRFPFVIGAEDPSGRFPYHVDAVRRGQVMGAHNRNARFSLIGTRQAAAFLAWLVEHPCITAVNACASGELTLEDLVECIAETLALPPPRITELGIHPLSPYALSKSLGLSNILAESLGFSFTCWRGEIQEVVRSFD